jgi:hypothetical protein
MWDLWWTKWHFGFPCQSFHRLLYAHHHLLSGAGTVGQIVTDIPRGLINDPLDQCSVVSSLKQGGIGMFLGCYCRNCLGDGRWEGRPRWHFHKPIVSVCHIETTLWTCVVFTWVFFNFMFRFVKLFVKLSKSANGTLRMLCEAFREHSLSIL